MTPFATRLPVAVLGATGAVGQAFIRSLDGHPWFDLVEVAPGSDDWNGNVGARMLFHMCGITA